MMYSSLDEAWSSPRFNTNKQIIESFDTTDCNCDELIKKILSCPGCVEQFKNMINSNNNSNFSTIQKIYRKYLGQMTPEIKEKLITFLLALAFVILILIILEK